MTYLRCTFNSTQWNIRRDPSPDLSETYILPCNRPTGGITIDYDTSSLASALWLGPAGFNSTSFQPGLNMRGEYYLSLTDKNGCSSELMIRLEEEKYSNPPDILSSVITCISPSSRVHLQSYDDIKTVYWINESGQSMEADTFEVFNPGRVKAIIENQSGCRATVSTDLEQDKEKVPFTINTPIVDCNDPAPEMYVTLGEDADTGRPISYEWYQENVMISNRPIIIVRDSMKFKAIVSYDNGCADSLSYFVKTDTIPPPFRLMPDTLNCKRSKIQLREEISIEGITETHWEGPEGFIQVGSSIASIFICAIFEFGA